MVSAASSPRSETRFGSLELPPPMTHISSVPDALKSGYGARQRRKNTAKSMICPDEREQVVRTPQNLVDAIVLVWGRVALDPCWAPGSLVPSEVHYYVPPRLETYTSRAKNKETGKYENVLKTRTYFRAEGDDQDGLALPWMDFTYCNPVYKTLDPWLAKAVREAEFGHEIMLLCPVRPHRVWWRAAERTTTKTCYLNPVTFVGEKSSLPLPLCMMYWGERGEQFQHIFESLKLGECL